MTAYVLNSVLILKQGKYKDVHFFLIPSLLFFFNEKGIKNKSTFIKSWSSANQTEFVILYLYYFFFLHILPWVMNISFLSKNKIKFLTKLGGLLCWRFLKISHLSFETFFLYYLK